MVARIGSNELKKGNAQQTQGVDKTIHIGIFFDGSGGNKFQMMLGRMYRSKEILKKLVDRDGKTMTIGEARQLGREKLKEKGLTESQMDELLYGYENMDDKNAFFVEDSFHPVDLVAKTRNDPGTEHQWEIADLYAKAKNDYKNNGETLTKQDKGKLGEGGVIQGNTYTNVAILEALYKNDSDYYPIYVEGMATEFANYNLVGIEADFFDRAVFAAGGGKTGIWQKVNKAILAGNRICNNIVGNGESISKLTVKMSVYGHSRGSTEARMFAYFYNPKDNDISAAINYNKDKITPFLTNSVKLEKHLNFVGLYDTVSAYIKLMTPLGNVDELYLYGIENSDYTLQLCAMDEFRNNFALTDISCVYNKGLDFFIPGCHGDVGGSLIIGVGSCQSINKSLIDSKYYINKWRSNGKWVRSEITVSTLKEMGWLSSDSIKTTNFSVSDPEIELKKSAHKDSDWSSQITFKRYVKPGYGSIPLSLMHIKANEKENLFSDIPPSYSVEEGGLLSTLLNRWKGSLNNKGCQFAEITPEEYKELRRNYLHYSADDCLYHTITSNFILSGAYYCDSGNNGLIITRKIFEGKKNSGKSYTLSSF